jgi:hypothetical protein
MSITARITKVTWVEFARHDNSSGGRRKKSFGYDEEIALAKHFEGFL